MKIILFNKVTFEPLLAFDASNQMNDDMATGLISSQMRVGFSNPLSHILMPEYTEAADLSVRSVVISFVLMRNIDHSTVHNGHLAFIAGDEVVRLNRQDLFALKRSLVVACGGTAQRDDDDFSIF